MSAKLDQLLKDLQATLGDKISKHVLALGEITIECQASDYLAVCQILRDAPTLKFEQLIDLEHLDARALRDADAAIAV
jgi:NADH-quinone oxidoreductase subunit C